MTATKRLPIAVEGLPFIAPMVAATALSVWSRWLYASVCLCLLTVFVVYFFRNPKRAIPPSDRVVLSPADGRVLQVRRCREERFFGGETTKVSIFMSLFDVHINRSPISGIVEEKEYNPGKFHLANREKSSMENEQNALVIRGRDGLRVLFIQIAGFVARRIVCYPEKGELLEKGQIFGMIRFGSRLDVYMPEGIETVVKPGERVRAGESILGMIL
ncbi:MAG: phosphatidylserine decarboxylase family protein [Deltaproteobacteria bacterium]|nr:phosphatidylserine decarboxylase family protein [Deltaproteobacteria bacterium]MBW2120307.1 phosphatidylserine decarboxylase family protein [Deltaproteobacteria bacterium]